MRTPLSKVRPLLKRERLVVFCVLDPYSFFLFFFFFPFFFFPLLFRMPQGFSAPCPSVGDAFISQVWLSGCIYTAASLYIIFACVAFGMLCIDLTSKKKKEWKIQVVGLSLVCGLCAIEAAFWFVLGSSYWTNNKLYFALSTIPQVSSCV